MASERSAEREDALRGAGYRVTVDGPPGWWWRHLAAGTAWLPPDVAEAYADHLIATGAPSGMSCTDHAAMEADRWVWRHRKWRVTRSSRENAERKDTP